MRFSVGDLYLDINQEAGTIECQSTTFEEAGFVSQIAVQCQSNSEQIDLISQPWSIKQVNMDQPSTPVGNLVGATIELNTSLQDVVVILRVGLSQDIDMAFIQLEVRNSTDLPLSVENLTLLEVQPGKMHLGGPSVIDPAFYSNGWQSWSTTGTYRKGDQQRSSILGPFQNIMVTNAGTPTTKGQDHFTSDMFTVIGNRSNQVGLLAGFLSQKEQFGSLETRFGPEPSLKMWANGDHTCLMPGCTMKTDWGVIQFIDLKHTEPMNTYFHAVAQAHKIPPLSGSPIGWCSWYHFYEDISEHVILSNLDAVAAQSESLPLTLFQIDDGFETRVGDWFSFKPCFPEGLKPIVDQIKSHKLTPGIWLAPFILHRKAALVKDHPDWLLRNSRGKPVNAGYVWNTFTYALDLTNPEALEYTCDVIQAAVEQWGFEYLKLDFLYAAALEGIYQDPTKTRAQVLRMGLEALRDVAGPEVTLLACGCPLGSALGLFEAMRIGADVSGSWEPHFPPVSPILRKEPNMPSARNALQNIITRAPLHQHWWINDPDCLLVREATDLSLDEVQTLATAIGLTGGSLLLSDDLPALSEDRIRLARVLTPLIEKRAMVLDWFDAETPSLLRIDMSGPVGDWHILACFNWRDSPEALSFSPQEFKLAQGQTWWLREFWTGAVGKMDDNKPFICNNVPPHGVRVISARQFVADRPMYLGSDIHLSQGIEISDWQIDDDKVMLGFSLGRQSTGKIDLYLPWQPEKTLAQKKSILLKDKDFGIYTIDLEIKNSTEIRIKRNTKRI